MIFQIIKKTTYLLCAGALLIFTSCNGDETENMDEGNTATESVKDTPRNSPSNTASGSQAENEALQNSPININTEKKVGTNLNPPHGEPGHDCAVQVGQPLPSGTGANMPIIKPTNNNSAVKLNPAHGQPGHDCAVPVGDPLN